MRYFGFLKKRFKKMKIDLIKNGTVIDHQEVGTGIENAKILGAKEYVRSSDNHSTVSIAMNVESKRIPGGRKDITKIENRELEPKETNKIYLNSPHSTINIIRDYKVVEKRKTKLKKGEILTNITKCTNPTCICNPQTKKDGTIIREPVPYKTVVTDEKIPKIKCFYCDRDIDDIYENLIF
ncbi:MAG: aspartate carbamoyltransferase regulatory subunit [archaeon]|nr:MAG: aspartate carbamoyltransferase regulatory subunit [archaeon]